jgi:hypothetical protein
MTPTASAACRELRLGAINTALHGLMPGMRGRLVKRRPQLRVFIRPGISMELKSCWRRVRRRRCHRFARWVN